MIVSATGHRPQGLGGFSNDNRLHLIDVAKVALHQLKPDHVISGMALGWDQAVAQAAVELGIPFTAALPFKSQPSKWPNLSKDIYKRLLELANTVVICSEDGYSARKMQIRNTWMVENSDTILAMWSGKESGGTYSCLKYALKKKKLVYNAYSIFNGDIEELIEIGAV